MRRWAGQQGAESNLERSALTCGPCLLGEQSEEEVGCRVSKAVLQGPKMSGMRSSEVDFRSVGVL